tara:strand:+ start:52 stop:195 length:144 start_codon:yes stop_codon:yes gene_type:complete
MKIALITWAIVIFICFLEAYFYAKMDPESEKFLKEREDERKNNNLHE